MTTAAEPGGDELRYAIAESVRRYWWVPLVSGILWLFVALIVLRFDVDSVRGVGIAAGVIFIVAGLEEFVLTGVTEGTWRWLHALFGVLLVVGGIVALANPVDTFVSIAALVGWILLLKGIFDVVLALTNRDAELWWMRLVLGVIELLLAVAVSGSFSDKAIFLLAFVGVTALMKGITNIVLAFQIRAHRWG